MHDERIYLRALEPDDYRRTIFWRNDDDIWKQLLGEKHFVSAEYEKKWVHDAIFSAQKEYRLGICTVADDLLIGLAALGSVDYVHRNMRSQLMIGEKSCHGQGLGTEALRLLLRFAFEDRGMERVWCRILKSNIPSLKLHAKVGFQQEGILRRSVYKEGGFQDAVILSILRHEYDSCR